MPNGGTARLGAWLRRVQTTWQEQDDTWTQKRFCGLIGVTPNGLRDWEKGRRETVHHGSKEAVARGLGIAVDQLDDVMEGEDVPLPPVPTPPSQNDAGRTDDERLAALENRIATLEGNVRDELLRIQSHLLDVQRDLTHLLREGREGH